MPPPTTTDPFSETARAGFVQSPGPGDLFLLAVAWLMLLGVVPAVRVLGVLRVRHLLAGATRWPRYPGGLAPERVGRAVRAASRAVPGVSCLGQALAAEALLRAHAEPVALALGLGRDDAGRLEGHAWLECEGVVVVGGPDVSRYARLDGVRPLPARE